MYCYVPAGRFPHERAAVPHGDLRVPAHQLPPEDGGDVGRRGRPRRRLLCLRRASLGRTRLPIPRRRRDEVSERTRSVGQSVSLLGSEQFLSRCQILVRHLTYIDMRSWRAAK